MELTKRISSLDFYRRYKHTGTARHAIFSGRKSLMEELYASGIPIYCDQSCYVHEQYLYRVEKVEDHFECDMYKRFEKWRDCHDYALYEDAEGNKVWLIKGGRYD